MIQNLTLIFLSCFSLLLETRQCILVSLNSFSTFCTTDVFCNSVCKNGVNGELPCGGHHTFKDNGITETFFSIFCIYGGPGTHFNYHFNDDTAYKIYAKGIRL